MGIDHKLIINKHINLYIISLCFLFCGVFFNARQSLAGAITPEEVKAVMIVKFTSFITWPGASLNQKKNKLMVGVLGDAEILNHLKSLEGKTVVGANPIIAFNVETANIPENINILYIGKTQVDKWPTIKKNVGQYVLTISDSDEFLEQGGIISFYKKPAGYIGFAVNRPAQIKSGLIFSSSLLRLADIKNE